MAVSSFPVLVRAQPDKKTELFDDGTFSFNDRFKTLHWFVHRHKDTQTSKQRTKAQVAHTVGDIHPLLT